MPCNAICWHYCMFQQDCLGFSLCIYKRDAPPCSRMLSQTSPIQLCEERNEELHKEGEKTRHRLEDTNVVFQDHGALSALTWFWMLLMDTFRRDLSKNLVASWIDILSFAARKHIYKHGHTCSAFKLKVGHFCLETGHWKQKESRARKVHPLLIKCANPQPHRIGKAVLLCGIKHVIWDSFLRVIGDGWFVTCHFNLTGLDVEYDQRQTDRSRTTTWVALSHSSRWMLIGIPESPSKNRSIMVVTVTVTGETP